MDTRSPATKADAIQRIVCRHFGIEPEAMNSKQRPHHIVWPRQVAMFLCWRLIKDTTTLEISLQFGSSFDRGTVKHAFRIVENRMETEPYVKALIEDLTKQFQTDIPKKPTSCA